MTASSDYDTDSKLAALFGIDGRSSFMHKCRMLVPCLASLFLLSIPVGTAGESIEKSAPTYMENIAQVINMVNTSYIGAVAEEELINGAIGGIVSKLDEYSSYFTKQEFDKMNAASGGEYVGIGIDVSVDKGSVQIINVLKSSPADEHGLRVGDVIKTIDGTSDIELSADWIGSRVAGKLGSFVDLSILRDNELRQFSVMRALLEVPSVEHKMVDPNVVLVKIHHFSKKTVSSMRSIWSQLDNKVQGIILDLRDNSGGLLEQAVGVSDAFLEGFPIVHTKDRDGNVIKTYKATNNSLDLKRPMVVLVNGGSASGAEIVAAALQDNDRALLVGEKTFGKGLLQEVFPLLAGGGAVKLTTASFCTPAKRDIQSVGISPDVLVLQSTQDSDAQLNKARDIMRYLIKLNH